MPVGIVSNGTILDRDRMADLARIGLDTFFVSFHGVGSTHDQAVGQEGAYERALEALRLWEGVGGRTRPIANFIPTEASIAHLQEFAQQVERMPHVTWRLSHLNFLTGDEIEQQRGAWARRFDDRPVRLLAYRYEPPPGAFTPLTRFLRSADGRRLLTKPILNDRETEEWYQPDFQLDRRCVFVWRSTFLNADGTVYPCQTFLIGLGNVRDRPLEDIWNGEEYVRFRATVQQQLMPGCVRCCKL